MFSFSYDDQDNWPPLADGNAYTLELIDPSAVPAAEPGRAEYLSDGTHWRRSEEQGGEPAGPVLMWDGLGDGDWDDVNLETGHSRWVYADGKPLTLIPDRGSNVVIREDTVVLSRTTNTEVGALAVESGQLQIDHEEARPVLQKLTLGPDEGPQVLSDGEFGIPSDAEFVSQLAAEMQGEDLALLTGSFHSDIDAGVYGSLTVEIAERSGGGSYCKYETRTIVTADPGGFGIFGEFATVPEVGDYLGKGVWFGNDQTGKGVVYVENGQEKVTAVEITVFQAKPGDTNGDRSVSFWDFNDLANNYTGALALGVGVKEWRQGDFDGDGDVDFADFNDLANNYTGGGVQYPVQELHDDGGGERAGGGDGADAAREDADGGGGDFLLDGAGEVQLIVQKYWGTGWGYLYGDDVAINGYSVISASGSLEDHYNHPYPFSMYVMNTEYEIDAGSINSPFYFDPGGEWRMVSWQFDAVGGTQDLEFYYGTSEGTFQGDVIYYGFDYLAGDGSGAGLDAASVQDWLYQLDPQMLDDLARFVAESESSANTPGAAAVDQLLALLLADAA